MLPSSLTSSATRPFSVLRQFARAEAPLERCELCGLALAPHHAHLLEPATRRMLCSCEPCSILFDGRTPNARYRRIPRRIRMLPDFRMSEEEWEALRLPINLAFFYHHSPSAKMVAMYPSPAGATESLLSLEAWNDLVGVNPVLSKMTADVEALLVNRTGPIHTYCLVPIDECFKLVGLIRTHWRGLSGGTEVWKHITAFFKSVDERSERRAGALHA